MIDGIIHLQRKLEDSNTQIGNNQQVRQQYNESMTKVKEAQESINRLAAVFNKEHGIHNKFDSFLPPRIIANM